MHTTLKHSYTKLVDAIVDKLIELSVLIPYKLHCVTLVLVESVFLFLKLRHCLFAGLSQSIRTCLWMKLNSLCLQGEMWFRFNFIWTYYLPRALNCCWFLIFGGLFGDHFGWLSSNQTASAICVVASGWTFFLCQIWYGSKSLFLFILHFLPPPQ